MLLFSVIVNFGIEQLVIREVSSDKRQARKYFGNFFMTELLLAAVVFIVLAGVAYLRHFEPIIMEAVLVLGFGMFLNALSVPHTAILSAYEDMHILAVVNFLDTLLNVVLIALAITFHFSIVFLALVQIGMGIMHWLVYQPILKRYLPGCGPWTSCASLTSSWCAKCWQLRCRSEF